MYEFIGGVAFEARGHTFAGEIELEATINGFKVKLTRHRDGARSGEVGSFEASYSVRDHAEEVRRKFGNRVGRLPSLKHVEALGVSRAAIELWVATVAQATRAVLEDYSSRMEALHEYLRDREWSKFSQSAFGSSSLDDDDDEEEYNPRPMTEGEAKVFLGILGGSALFVGLVSLIGALFGKPAQG